VVNADDAPVWLLRVRDALDFDAERRRVVGGLLAEPRLLHKSWDMIAYE
jgi:hypothetical protein